MSKSGLHAHFRPKEELLLATVDTADALLGEQVIVPGLEAPEGRKRLLALCDAFASHVERRVFRGGCFFASAAAELSTQPGRVREQTAESYREWTALLEGQAEKARELGELPHGVDVSQLVFELNGMLVAASVFSSSTTTPGELERARRGVRERLANPG